MRVVLFYLIIASSVLWGAFYPNILRLPAYQWLAFLFVLTTFRINVNRKFIIVGLLFLTYTAFIAEYFSSFLYCLAIISFIYFFSSSSIAILKFTTSINKLKSYIIIAITLNSVVLVYQYAFVDTQFISGLFPEPSHLGYTLGPLLALMAVNNSTKRLSLVNLSICYLLSPSVTLAVSFVVTYILWLVRAKDKLILFAVVVLMLLIGSVSLYCYSAFELAGSQAKNESLQIWLFGYFRAFDLLTNVSIFGVGPFGWIPESGEQDASSFAIELMNQRDLASMIPFGIASFGPFFVFLLLYFLYLVLKFDVSDYWDTFFSLVVLGFIVSACFRWAGFTLTPLLIFASVLIAVRSKVKPI
jgi:hypothetical protein